MAPSPTAIRNEMRGRVERTGNGGLRPTVQVEVTGQKLCYYRWPGLSSRLPIFVDQSCEAGPALDPVGFQNRVVISDLGRYDYARNRHTDR